MSHHFVA